MTEPHPLLIVLIDHFNPEPSTVSQIEKNGNSLDYVGHAEITKILIEIDPEWSWTPIAWENGRPQTTTQLGKITKRDGTVLEFPTVSMWGQLTLLGVTRIAVGSAEAHKADLDKELVSDFLRNAAMRFGISLALWTKGTPPSKASTSNPFRGTPRTQTLGSKSEGSAEGPTEAQLGLLRKRNYEGPVPDTKAECSKLIDRLLNG
jgi:hypothetical protein